LPTLKFGFHMKTFLNLAAAILVGMMQLKAEPIYQGKPESYWFNLLSRPHSFEFQKQWQGLGTNQTAVLLDAVEVRNIPNAAAIRTNAAMALLRSGDPAILISLVTSNFDPQVKVWAYSGLIFNGDKSVTKVMVDSLKNSNADVRLAAISGLGLSARQMTPEEFPALIGCLHDPEPDVRLAAAEILNQSGSGMFLPPGKTRQDVAEAAITEIKKAVNSPDPDVSEPAAKAVKETYPEFGLQVFTQELAIRVAESHGTEWAATLKVVDENGNPIEGADVRVTYYVPAREPGGDAWSSTQKIEGLTGKDGGFTASHKDSSFQLGFAVQKAGFYSAHSGYEFLVNTNRNPLVKLVLKRIIHPIPMYFNRVDIAHKKKPAFDKPIGFDLTVGDWVAPYGKGTNAHMYFTWHIDQDTNDVSAIYGKQSKFGWDSTMKISFPNPGDGIQEFDMAEGGISDLHSPQEAPADGYHPQLFKRDSWHPPQHPGNSVVSTNDIYHGKDCFLRVSTVLDKDGHMVSAQYGKIYGSFDQAFSTYLNPETNSRSIEYDVKHNLGRGGGYDAY